MFLQAFSAGYPQRTWLPERRKGRRMDTLKLTLTSRVSNDAFDVGEDNPVNRALNALLEDGKPIRSFSMCHLKVPPEAATPKELRWVGVFVLSQGDRLLYFPGFSYERFLAFQGKTAKEPSDFAIDHLSLESNFLRWHITSFKSNDHLGSPRTCPLGKGRHLWFGLSVANLEVFRPVCHKTKISVPTPSIDSRRRIDAFMSSREDNKDVWVGLPPGATATFDPFFFHIAVIAGPKGFTDYLGPQLGFPEGSPSLAMPLPEGRVSLPTRHHRITLSEGVDLQIVLTCLPGALNVPAAFTGVEV